MIKTDHLKFQQQQSCMNCQTSTTPLWRRDEVGSVLCNACGLFLKLHGRPRPISLKKDVIKSRNRIKGSNSGIGLTKKPPFEPLDHARSQVETISGGPLEIRRPSHKSINGDSEFSISPNLRNEIPSMFNCHLPPFGCHPLDDHYAHKSPSQTSLKPRQVPSRRSVSPSNGIMRNVAPLTYEQLVAQNSSLKTRVSELEVINELVRGRAVQLEQDEINARRDKEIHRRTNSDLLRKLEESQRRENQLKHRLGDVENSPLKAKDGISHIKKMRVSDMVVSSEILTSRSLT